MKYEIFNEAGEVVNLIVAEQWFVDKYHAGRYRPYVEIIIPNVEITLPPVITRLAMMMRFTENEYMAALTAAKTDVEVEMWMDYLSASATVNLLSDRVKKGVNALLAKGVVTADRANEILSTKVRADEAP
jgi:hypothetical protein